MPITYRIAPELRLAYIRAQGRLSVSDVMAEGAQMLTEEEWENGFGILCDYRGVTCADLDPGGVGRVVEQDTRHEPRFGKSKCAVVANSDLVYGYARMWELLSDGGGPEKMVFRNIDDALAWLGLEPDALDSLGELP